MNGFLSALGALAPPVGVGLVFWLVMRWIVQADRRERLAIARMEAAERDGAGTRGTDQQRSGEPQDGHGSPVG